MSSIIELATRTWYKCRTAIDSPPESTSGLRPALTSAVCCILGSAGEPSGLSDGRSNPTNGSRHNDAHGKDDRHPDCDGIDGLSRDLANLCQMSGVGAIIDAATIPIHEDAIKLSGQDGKSPLEHALHDVRLVGADQRGGALNLAEAVLKMVEASLHDNSGIEVLGHGQLEQHPADLGIRVHRGVRIEVIVAPSSQDQPVGLEPTFG